MTRTWTATDLIEKPETITEFKLQHMEPSEVDRLAETLIARSTDDERSEGERYRFERKLDVVEEQRTANRLALQHPTVQLAAILDAGGGQLDSWGLNFASDLVRKADRGLSDKQLFWVVQLIQRAAGFYSDDPETPQEKTAVDVLRAALDDGRVSDRDASFASSLVEQHDRSGKLSSKQQYWVEKLADRYDPDAEPEEPVADKQVVTKLFELFDHAAEHRKFPKIVIQTEATRSGQIKFKMTGNRSAFPGTISIDDGRPYGQNEWYGRIHRDGRWEKTREVTEEIEAIVQSFIDDPITAGKAHGLETSWCCFCGKELTNPRSLTQGYGPICAEKWGLPWGEIDEERFPTGKNNNDWRSEEVSA